MGDDILTQLRSVTKMITTSNIFFYPNEKGRCEELIKRNIRRQGKKSWVNIN